MIIFALSFVICSDSEMWSTFFSCGRNLEHVKIQSRNHLHSLSGSLWLDCLSSTMTEIQSSGGWRGVSGGGGVVPNRLLNLGKLSKRQW